VQKVFFCEVPIKNKVWNGTIEIITKILSGGMVNSKDHDFTQIVAIFILLSVCKFYKNIELYVCYSLVLNIGENILRYTRRVICTIHDDFFF
jgi:hypothetical protein